MTENQETIAKALEIAITLTGAKHTSLQMDENKNIIIDESLLNTMEKIIRIMNAQNLNNICNTSRKEINKWAYPAKKTGFEAQA